MLHTHAMTRVSPLQRLRASIVVPASCRLDRDRVVQARVRNIAPVLAALTAGWIALDHTVLTLSELLPVAAVRLTLAAALLVLARWAPRLSGPNALRAFILLQVFGFAGLQLLFPRDPQAAQAIGYGLFPFAVAAQLALFPATWLQVVRLSIAPVAMLALNHAVDGRHFDVEVRNDVWLLALLLFVAAWTAHSQLVLLVKLLGARRDAAHDALTGLANRRQADARLSSEYARCARHGEPMSVLMADLDHFKCVNDRYGHAAGDVVLAAASDVIAAELRASDIGARYGGEEFLVLLPEAGWEAALHVAERIREGIAALHIPVRDSVIRVTVSIGVAELRPGEDIDSLVRRADAALYRAKASGRDRCVVDAQDAPA